MQIGCISLVFRQFSLWAKVRVRVRVTFRARVRVRVRVSHVIKIWV